MNIRYKILEYFEYNIFQYSMDESISMFIIVYWSWLWYFDDGYLTEPSHYAGHSTYAYVWYCMDHRGPYTYV